MESKSESQRDGARRRLTLAGRIALVGSGDERDFHTSSYVTRTLPTLLGRMTAPIVRTSPVTAAA